MYSDEAAGSQTYIQKKGAAVLLLPTSNNQKPTNYDTKSLVSLKGIEPLFPREVTLGVLTDRRKRQKKIGSSKRAIAKPNQPAAFSGC